MANVQGLYDKLRTQIDLLNENIEPSEWSFVSYLLTEVPSQPAIT